MAPDKKSRATRNSLVELAGEMFASSGYSETSVRDIARRGAVTSGAIYGHFRNKADLLAVAISERTASELESRSVEPGRPADYIETLTRLAKEYPRRKRLRALILQGATAARTDDETRTALKAEQVSYLGRWLEQYEEHRDRMGIEASVDMNAALLYTWAAELGLGVLEGIGVDLPSPQAWADTQNRFARALQFAPDGGSQPATKPAAARADGRARSR